MIESNLEKKRMTVVTVRTPEGTVVDYEEQLD